MSAANVGMPEVNLFEQSGPTLADAIRYFSNEDNCVKYLAAHRWPEGVVRCPVCGQTKVRFIASRRVWECTTPHKKAQFSVRAGTLLEDSHLTLQQWLVAIWILATSESPVSSYEMAKRLHMTQKSAWLMLRRIGSALQVTRSTVSGLKQDFYNPKTRSRQGSPNSADQS